MRGRRALIAALVLVLGVVGLKAGSERAAHNLSPEGLAKVSDYIRNEIATRQDPRRHPAPPAARQAGLLREFRRPRRRDRDVDERGHDLPPLFDVEAGHVSHGDDAGRGGQAQARRSCLEIHSGLCRHEGRRREEGRRWQGRAGAGAGHSSGHNQGPAAPHLRAALRLSWRRHGARTLCRGQSLQQQSQQCRLRRQDRHAAAGRAARHGVGLRLFHPTCSAASSRSSRERRCFSSRRNGCSIRSA
ncbi:hypothetical protein ACVWYI_005808 [Bradyrhizobium sp. LB13.1]